MKKFTESMQEIIQNAVNKARENNNPEVTPAHILHEMFTRNDEIIDLTFQNLSASPAEVGNELGKIISKLPSTTGGSEPTFGSFTAQFIEQAEKTKKSLGDEYLSVEHFLIAAPTTQQQSVKTLFQSFNLSEKTLKNAVTNIPGREKVTSSNPEAKLDVLTKFAKDLTQYAKENKLDPIIGRDEEVRRVIQILSRRTKNNPVLIGEPGVGKTAIAEGLAQRVIRGDVPTSLKDRKIMSLDLSALVAGAKFRGEFEERLKAVIKAVQEAQGKIVLFIDEIHTLVNAGAGEGAVDAGNMLKPALSRGELRCIGATTLDEYREIEKDPALERRFQPVLVDPPNIEDCITILRGIKERYEIHHGVQIRDSALVAAAQLSDKYITSRFLPDKAIDLIDEAAARLQMQIDSVPEPLDIVQRKITQIKMELASLEKEKDSLSHNRTNELKEELRDLEGRAEELDKQWRMAKGSGEEVSQLKKRVEDLKNELSIAKSQQDYERAGQIQYGELPELEKQLSSLQDIVEKRSQNTQASPSFFKEDVTAEDVAEIVSQWTGIPVAKMLTSERERLLNLEAELRESVIGQETALIAVSNAIRLSRSGLREQGRPMGTFLFLGPTGVGKTETVKALSRSLFDSEKALLRFDMSEFMEEHSVAKLIGSPPGYVGFEDGGILTEGVRRKPYSVVLFDEIEKAHPKVLNILLQLLDDGRVTDSHGRTVSFQNTIVILTSNIGAHQIQQATEEGKGIEEIKQAVMSELRNYLRPELINRIDDSIVFNPVSREMLQKIVHIQVKKLQKRLESQNLSLTLSPEVVKLVAEKGFDPIYGARPVKRALQDLVEVPLSQGILAGKFQEGGEITGELESGKVIFRS